MLFIPHLWQTKCLFTRSRYNSLPRCNSMSPRWTLPPCMVWSDDLELAPGQQIIMWTQGKACPGFMWTGPQFWLRSRQYLAAAKACQDRHVFLLVLKSSCLLITKYCQTETSKQINSNYLFYYLLIKKIEIIIFHLYRDERRQIETRGWRDPKLYLLLTSVGITLA